MKNPLALLEKDIERACCDLLEADGWIVRKMEKNFSERKRKSTGEKGMSDRLCIRYVPRDQGKPQSAMPSGMAEVLWIEFKRLVPQPTRVIEKGRPKQRWPRSTQAAVHQKAWHAIERKRGALTLIAGEDFIASIDGFRDWYRESGLMRNGKAAGG